jgi:hypothetical protein
MTDSTNPTATNQATASAAPPQPPPPDYFVPTRLFIEQLGVGDLAPDCFGAWRRVTEIFARTTDEQGRLFVCYYVEHGRQATMSSGLKERELHRTLRVCQKHTSVELDLIEQRLLAGLCPYCQSIADEGERFTVIVPFKEAHSRAQWRQADECRLVAEPPSTREVHHLAFTHAERADALARACAFQRSFQPVALRIGASDHE